MANKVEYIQRFKEIYKKNEGEDLTDQEALEYFDKLVLLVQSVYKPISKKFLKEVYCPACKRPIIFSDFKDPPSEKEFLISGLCQNCQNKTFKKHE